MSDQVGYEQIGNIVTITLNRPEKLNAYTPQMRQDLADALAQAEDDNEVRAVILTGAGRAFCAGADTSGNVLGGSDNLIGLEHAVRGPAYVLARMDTPTIAAINGLAFGVGFELTMGCDFRIMASTAVLNDVHVSRGLLADAGAPWLLPRIAGWEAACEVLLLGESIDANQAVALGIVRRVVQPDDVLPTARALAERLAAKAPLAVQGMKRLMREGLSREQKPTMELSARMYRELQKSEDLHEGIQAFQEKRAPLWKGR